MPTNPKPSADRPEGDRIAKLLARAGVASRREIERMIADKRITLNGTPVETRWPGDDLFRAGQCPAQGYAAIDAHRAARFEHRRPVAAHQ